MTAMLFSILNDFVRTLNYAIEQVRSNAWYIFLFIISIYIVSYQVKKLRHRTSGVTLGTSDNGIDKRTNSTGRSKREEEMYQARLRQQEILNQKAKEALEQKRELLKTKPKNDDPSSEPNSTHDNETSQTSSTKKPSSLATTKSKLKAARTTEYNPMNPWSASAGGGTYRPSRRANPRGGG